MLVAMVVALLTATVAYADDPLVVTGTGDESDADTGDGQMYYRQRALHPAGRY
jgi:hypothetical protein